MTQEELEGNKLVAIYMDASITDIPGMQKPIVYPVNGGNSVFLTRLKYHKSMDWLYPVYQKICKFMQSEIFLGHKDNYGKSLLYQSFFRIAALLNHGEDVFLIFKEIVEWIKIYNEKVLEDDK